MNNYQLTLVISNKLEEKERKGLLDSLSKKLGKVEKQDLWGVRGLSYPIKKHSAAFYAHYEFSTDPKEISSIDKMVKLNEDIIRYLLLKKD